jgi:hypothetical protein
MHAAVSLISVLLGAYRHGSKCGRACKLHHVQPGSQQSLGTTSLRSFDIRCTLQVNEILNAGADLSCKDLEGRTPAQIATKPELVDLIKEFEGKKKATTTA